MPRLSFIMPVKNGEDYVAQAVRSVERQAERDWELVVVDDHSTDDTLGVLKGIEREDPRIRIFENSGSGLVQALNHAYGMSSGRFLKFIDGDDLLAAAFSRNLDRVLRPEATYHEALIFEGTSAATARLRIGRRFEDMDLEESLRHLMVSPPRWAWTFSREVGDRVFPLPVDLPTPHADIYVALMFKKHAGVVHIPLPLYYYRQHPNQVYGGLFNFSREAVSRRAKAVLRIIEFIAAGELVEGMENPEGLLRPSRRYYGFLAEETLRWSELLRTKLPLSWKLRVAVIRGSPRLASRLSRRRAARKIKGCSPETGGT